MSFESDKARKRSIYIPCGLIKYSFPLNLFSARSEKLTQWLQIVAGFIINSGSSQFQTGSSPTQIFMCISLQATAIYHFQYSPSFETGVRDGKAM